MSKTIFPPYLRKGDSIGITCPAGFLAFEKIQSCKKKLNEWGLNVIVGHTIGGNSENYFSGTDEDRLNDFQNMLNDKSIKAILCGRGGYGISRIIDKIDFKQFKKNPKWIIGFSDITLLHLHIYRNYKISTLHAPMAAGFDTGDEKNESILSIKKNLFGKKTIYNCETHYLNKLGKTRGKIVGGNLAMIAHACGTNSEIDTKNNILFIEDIGEYIYNIDRMMQQLKRCGILKNLSGLIVGGFTETKDTDRPFGKTAYEVIKDATFEYPYPVCFNFPISHSKENYAVKIGSYVELNIAKNRTSLREI